MKILGSMTKLRSNQYSSIKGPSQIQGNMQNVIKGGVKKKRKNSLGSGNMVKALTQKGDW